MRSEKWLAHPKIVRDITGRKETEERLQTVTA